jgi:hypothetical protein
LVAVKRTLPDETEAGLGLMKYSPSLTVTPPAPVGAVVVGVVAVVVAVAGVVAEGVVAAFVDPLSSLEPQRGHTNHREYSTDQAAR